MSNYFSSLSASLRYRPIVSLFACSAALGTGYFAPIYYDNYKRRQQSLNGSSFTPYTLIAKHRISSSSAIFVLRPPSSYDAQHKLQETWNSDSLWSVQAKQPQLQIGREYTPMPPSRVLESLSSGSAADAAADIHLLIRREKNGEMTTYLHGLQPPLATVNLRGPYQDVRIPSHVDEVLFIAGGTGISPALQVAHIMSRRPNAKVTILWANRRREECFQAPISKDSVVTPNLWTRIKKSLSGTAETAAKSNANLRDAVEAVVREGIPSSAEKGLVVRILEEMQSRSPNLRVEYFVDEEDSFIKHTDIRKILARSEAASSAIADSTSNNTNNTSSSSNSSESSSTTTSSTSTTAIAQAATRESTSHAPLPTVAGAKLILVGGPNGFVDYWAGRKRMQDGREVQGPLGGALGEMELHGWKVWKL